MKPKTQLECMDDKCRTITVYANRRNDLLDGLRCVRCDGPVLHKPFEPVKPKVSDKVIYVRGSIFKENKQHCFNLTDEQIETVLTLGDDFEKTIHKKGENQNEFF